MQAAGASAPHCPTAVGPRRDPHRSAPSSSLGLHHLRLCPKPHRLDQLQVEAQVGKPVSPAWQLPAPTSPRSAVKRVRTCQSETGHCSNHRREFCVRAGPAVLVSPSVVGAVGSPRGQYHSKAGRARFLHWMNRVSSAPYIRDTEGAQARGCRCAVRIGRVAGPEHAEFHKK
jgi:hypothetical protein